MISGFRRWLGQRRPGAGGRLPIGLLLAVALLFTVQEIVGGIVGEVADGALFDLPWWMRVVVVAVLVGIAGAVYTAVNPADEPAPDPPADQPAVPVAPAPPPGFFGRTDDLAAVIELVTDNHATAIVGGRGVGTSAFALRVAQEIRDLFPDGQVYVDLRGAAAGSPLSPARALWRVMRKLGLAEPQLSRRDRLDAAAEELHAWLASRAVLLILDNVDDPEQVRLLLPNAPGCRALLAGSVELERLDAVRTFLLGDLGTDDAVGLLALAANDPALATRDRADAETLVDRCSRQPLAIRLVGELIRDRAWSVERAASAVVAGQRAPRATESGDVVALQPLWDACDLTYRDLPPRARRLFRLLALVPSTEIGTGAAAAVAGFQPPAATELLEVLARRGLIESVRPGRYRFRQMLASSAWRYLAEDSTWRVSQASLRLVRHYATIAEEYAEQLLPATGDDAERNRAVSEARAWFRQEREVLFRMATTASFVAVRGGRLGRPVAVAAWQQRLAIALCTWFAADGRIGEWEDVCEAVLAGQIGPNPRTVEFWARNELATVRRLSGDPTAAATLLSEAAKLCRGRYHRGLAQARTNHGLALLDLGDVEAAVVHLDAGLTLRPRSDLHGRATSALGLGVAYLRRAELAAARQYLVEALNHFDALGDLRGVAATFNNLGVVLWRQRDRVGALEHWAIARDRFSRVGDPAGAASVLHNEASAMLSEEHTAPGIARTLLLEAVRLTAGRPPTRDTGLLHLHLGDAYLRCGEPAPARDEWQRAFNMLTSLGCADAEQAGQRLAGT